MFKPSVSKVDSAPAPISMVSKSLYKMKSAETTVRSSSSVMKMEKQANIPAMSPSVQQKGKPNNMHDSKVAQERLKKNYLEIPKYKGIISNLQQRNRTNSEANYASLTNETKALNSDLPPGNHGKNQRRPSQVIPPKITYPDFHVTQSNYYKMDNESRGKVVIFLHTKFESSEIENREGGDLDVRSLKEVLPRLGFKQSDITVHKDLTMKEVLSALFDLAQENHNNRDCLMVFFLTHGENNDQIHAADTEYSITKIWSKFIGDSCPTLICKPKIFFIVACRGNNTDSGIKVDPKGTTQTRMDAQPINNARQFYTIPSEADMLTVYSTTPGHYSYRETERGTWYIEALCKEIKNLQPSQEINFTDFLANVNRRLATIYQTHNPIEQSLNRKKQCSSYTSTFTRAMMVKINENQ